MTRYGFGVFRCAPEARVWCRASLLSLAPARTGLHRFTSFPLARDGAGFDTAPMARYPRTYMAHGHTEQTAEYISGRTKRGPLWVGKGLPARRRYICGARK